ncbi:MAG: hypothetical protein KF812_03740 [Fimbriimonadaceae bacterium]|nr:hypothetical protein [Fimbriimonadaceae bacterium]
MRSRKQKGISLVEVVSATVCVGVLGTATVAGTTAARARLGESVLTRQAVSAAQNKIETLRMMGRQATLAPGTMTESVLLNDTVQATVETVVQGKALPDGELFSLEGLDGDPASISTRDRELGELMALRVLGNNDLSQFVSMEGAPNFWTMEIEFGSTLKDNSNGADTAPELILLERGGNGGLQIEPIDQDGNSLAKAYVVSPTQVTFSTTTPSSGLPNNRSREEARVVGLDLSAIFGLTECKRFRISHASGPQPNFKFIGFDTTGWPTNSLSPQFRVSGPGTNSSYIGPVMLNGIESGSFQSSRIEVVTGVKNFSFSGNLNQCKFYSRPSTIWDVQVRVLYQATSMVGKRDREVTVDSAVSIGTLYN